MQIENCLVILKQTAMAQGGRAADLAVDLLDRDDLPQAVGRIDDELTRLEAQTLLTLVDSRTTEQIYVAEGTAKKKDIKVVAAPAAGAARQRMSRRLASARSAGMSGSSS